MRQHPAVVRPCPEMSAHGRPSSAVASTPSLIAIPWMLQIFNSLGNLGWAYGFSVILLEIQDSIRRGPPLACPGPARLVCSARMRAW